MISCGSNYCESSEGGKRVFFWWGRGSQLPEVRGESCQASLSSPGRKKRITQKPQPETETCILLVNFFSCEKKLLPNVCVLYLYFHVILVGNFLSVFLSRLSFPLPLLLFSLLSFRPPAATPISPMGVSLFSFPPRLEIYKCLPRKKLPGNLFGGEGETEQETVSPIISLSLSHVWMKALLLSFKNLHFRSRKKFRWVLKTGKKCIFLRETDSL